MPAAAPQPHCKPRRWNADVHVGKWNAGGLAGSLLERRAFPQRSRGVPVLQCREHARILDYYRYSAYGSATILPAHDHGTTYGLVDGNGDYDVSGTDTGSGNNAPWDLLEDTPLTLTDNNALMLARGEGEGGYSSRGESYGRVSQFANHYTFTARRWDSDTGLMHYRYRYYETVSGRFVGRDPLFYIDYWNGYAYVGGRTVAGRDPFGTDTWTENTTSVGGWHRRVCVDVWDDECTKKIGKYCISFGLSGGAAGSSASSPGGDTSSGGGGQGSSSAAASDAPAEGKEGYGKVYEDMADEAVKEISRCESDCETDKKIKKYLEEQVEKKADYNALTNSCRHFSNDTLSAMKKAHGLKEVDTKKTDKEIREARERWAKAIPVARESGRGPRGDWGGSHPGGSAIAPAP